MTFQDDSTKEGKLTHTVNIMWFSLVLFFTLNICFCLIDKSGEIKAGSPGSGGERVSYTDIHWDIQDTMTSTVLIVDLKWKIDIKDVLQSVCDVAVSKLSFVNIAAHLKCQHEFLLKKMWLEATGEVMITAKWKQRCLF